MWPSTALGCNHQSICMPQIQPLIQLLASARHGTDALPQREEGSGESYAVYRATQNIGTHSGLEPGTSGFPVQSSNRYTTAAPHLRKSRNEGLFSVTSKWNWSNCIIILQSKHIQQLTLSWLSMAPLAVPVVPDCKQIKTWQTFTHFKVKFNIQCLTSLVETRLKNRSRFEVLWWSVVMKINHHGS